MHGKHGENDAIGIVSDLLGFRPDAIRPADAIAAIDDRMRARATSSLAAYRELLRDATERAAEVRALADRLTVNETYFFREEAHHRVLADVAARALDTPLRILCLGCASGEEPYGIAITLNELGLRPEEVEIVAVDASPKTLARAERGVYSAWSLRYVSESIRARYFTPDRERFVLTDAVRDRVRFEVGNLLDPLRAAPESFDVVFCRNVFIDFTKEATAKVLDEVHRVLRQGGSFFLGDAETLHAGPRFEPCEGSGSFYFRKAVERTAASVHPGSHEVNRVDADAERSGSVRTSGRPSPPPASAELVPDGARDDHRWIDACLATLRAERFDETFRLLEAAPDEPMRHVVRAAILANRGAVHEARAACGHVLDATASDAEAHYLLGLCDELERRFDDARQHYVHAAGLDEDFAMPRLRLGILARRRRDFDEARRWLGEALRLFPYQSERVLLLFGGGFRADGLTRLCRTEFDACKKIS